MPKRRNFYRRNKYLIWAFLAPFFILEGIAVIMKVEPFGNNSFLIVDALHQYLPFFADYHEKLRSLDSLFYSFSERDAEHGSQSSLYYKDCPVRAECGVLFQIQR